MSQRPGAFASPGECVGDLLSWHSLGWRVTGLQVLALKLGLRP